MTEKGKRLWSPLSPRLQLGGQVGTRLVIKLREEEILSKHICGGVGVRIRSWRCRSPTHTEGGRETGLEEGAARVESPEAPSRTPGPLTAAGCGPRGAAGWGTDAGEACGQEFAVALVSSLKGFGRVPRGQ